MEEALPAQQVPQTAALLQHGRQQPQPVAQVSVIQHPGRHRYAVDQGYAGGL